MHNDMSNDPTKTKQVQTEVFNLNLCVKIRVFSMLSQNLFSGRKLELQYSVKEVGKAKKRGGKMI